MKRLVVGAVVLGLASHAAAEPPGLVPPVETAVIGGKGEDVATALAIGGIVVPFAFVAYGASDDSVALPILGALATIPGPAIAHWYTNHVGTYGMLARLGGFSFFMAGVTEIDDVKRCQRGTLSGVECQDISRGEGRVMAGIGIGLVAASWAYDLVTSRAEVRRFNAARTFQIAPMAAPNTYGVALAGTL
jgi:hypothetical protein